MNDKLNKGYLIVWQRAVYINPEGAAAKGGEQLVVGQIAAQRPAGHHVAQQHLDITQSIHPTNHVKHSLVEFIQVTHQQMLAPC